MAAGTLIDVYTGVFWHDLELPCPAPGTRDETLEKPCRQLANDSRLRLAARQVESSFLDHTPSRLQGLVKRRGPRSCAATTLSRTTAKTAPPRGVQGLAQCPGRVLRRTSQLPGRGPTRSGLSPFALMAAPSNRRSRRELKAFPRRTRARRQNSRRPPSLTRCLTNRA